MATTRATELGQLAKLVTVDSNGNSVIAGTFDATLPASGVVAGVHGSASSVPIMSVTAQGLIDSVGSAPINTATSLSFDSATGQLTLGFSDASNISQTLTLDPFTTDDLTEGSNLYYTDARFDSAFGVKTTADLTEGSNLYYTDVRFDSAFGDKSTTNLTEGDNLYYTQGRFDSALGDKTTDNLTEGSNLYYTTARADSDAKAAISVTDAGGDGSLTYSAGAITYTGPSASEVRAHFSGGTGVDISSGVVSIGQSVDSSSSVIFQSLETTGNVTVGGNLQVNGATTTVSSQNLSIEDNMLYLNQLESDGSPTIEVDVGFAANVNDTGTYAHTGFFRDATDATWKLFDGYTPEPDSDLDIDINHASFEYADLQVADLTAGNITVSGTVDGRDVAADGTKLDGIETGATADQTKADIDALNINADQVDGLEASQFLRSDASDDMTGTLTVSGNVGIGTTSLDEWSVGSSYKILSVGGSGSAGILNLVDNNISGSYLQFGNTSIRRASIHAVDGSDVVFTLNSTNSGTGLTERVRFTNDGNVGIGVSSPQRNLQVHATSGDASIKLSNATTGSGNLDGVDITLNTSNQLYITNRESGPTFFENGGSVKMAILSGGNVGIGTTSPQQKLQVDGNIYLGPNNSTNFVHSGGNLTLTADTDVYIVSDANDDAGESPSGDIVFGGGSNTNTDTNQDFTAAEFGTGPRNEWMRIESSNGNVGIGSTSPSNQLEVTGGTNKAVISVTNADLGSLHYTDRNGRYLTSNGSGWTSGVDGADPGIVIGSDNSSGQIRGVGIVLHNDNNSDNQYSPTISFGNKSNSGSYNTAYAHIIGRKTGQATDANWSAGEIGFYTQPVGGYVTNTPRLLINSAGNVGIGTSSPSNKLHVYQTADAPAMAITSSNPGNWGASLIIGNTTADQTLIDGSDRPVLALDGNYPVFNLNHTATTNTNHGPTIQFTFDGYTSNRQIVIGTDGQGQRLDFGFSGGSYGTNSDKNPHNGISGYNGLTPMRLFSNGLLLGSTGTYPNEITSASYALDVRGTGYASTDFRAPIFYDSNDTAYYTNPAGDSTFAYLYLRTGGLKMQRNYNDNAIWWNSGTDQNHVLWNHYYGGPRSRGGAASGGFDGMKWNTYQGLYIQGGLSGAYTVARFSTTGGGSTNTHFVQLYANNVEQLGTRNGYALANNQMRSPIFYDSANTGYYFDGSATGDSIRVAGDIVAYYSDERLKDKEGNISGAIDKVSKLNGFYYRANKKAQELGYDTRLQVGVSAQEVEAVLPEVVKDAPIGQGYKTVKYDRMVPLLIEAIKEQQEIINKQSQDIDELKQLVKQLMENK